jgi:hypothetical protein
MQILSVQKEKKRKKQKMVEIKECKLREEFRLVQKRQRKLGKAMNVHLFLVVFLRRDVFVLLLDDDSKLLNFLAELIAFLLAFCGLIFEELAGSLELFVSGFDLEFGRRE